ncbi:carbohydrate ABC transporter membrane protein 2 (CUT1 family) [Hydrogenispora ethanolica]|uniref:Carbohydrate ABC transporter membrane protein 2 (CUT1 family) n=1 Tax=Hydrogenispora ethanolica TaxID=1082276 RepID=A0A4V2QAT3_HYDET|nr:carbohydrate ABC transporter permease [Hydrogenispora ethanolica]TCL53672.1 carbohydrate ABC transporter membrane protein 2 (CUT1 family) [Hydrogenispora ethanolica]
MSGIKSSRDRIFDFINITLLTFLMVITLYPFLYVIFASLSDPSRIMAYPGLLYKPLGFSLGAYKAVIKNPNIFTGYVNTCFLVTVGVAVNITMTALGAYFLSRKNVLWGKVVMFFIVFTMFFNGGLIPLYFTVKGLRLDNSLCALILPTAINTFNLIIMRTAFMAIPDSIEESAKIDGAGHLLILFRIIVPLAMPTIAVMILFYGVGHWNAWFQAMIFLQNRELFPLQLILREILLMNDSFQMAMGANVGDQEMISETIKYAVIIVATLPILCLYPFLQKYFVKGVMVGSLKE